MTHAAPPPGTILLGKYRIEAVLGEGGMGVVARAHHLQLDEPVAIKFLLPQVLGNYEVVQRFLREAQAAVKLKSEHVARVIDVGTLPDGAPYMVMEYLEGGDLSAMLRQYGPLGATLAADLMLQACDAMAEAHSLGIVHRDIKPSNFFVTRRRDGSLLLKVLDFGISKAPVTVDAGLTKTQSVMGTPAYMSPEQMRSTRSVDARSDVWSMGVVLYELLGGRRPFESEAFSELCIKVAMDPLPPLTVPLPAGLDELVARCLEKEPERRVQNVSELAAGLVPFATDTAAASAVAERCARLLGVRPGAVRAPTFQTMAMPSGPGTPVPGYHTPPPGYHTPPPGSQHPSYHPGPSSVTGTAAQVMSPPPPGARRGRIGLIVGGVVLAGGAIAAVAVLASGGGDSGGAAPPAAAGSADGTASDPVAATPDDPPTAPPADPGAAAAGSATADTAAGPAGDGDGDDVATGTPTEAVDAGAAAAEPPDAATAVAAGGDDGAAEPKRSTRTRSSSRRGKRTGGKTTGGNTGGKTGGDDIFNSRE